MASDQSAKYWLTPAGCIATGGHLIHCEGCHVCLACGADLKAVGA